MNDAELSDMAREILEYFNDLTNASVDEPSASYIFSPRYATHAIIPETSCISPSQFDDDENEKDMVYIAYPINGKSKVTAPTISDSSDDDLDDLLPPIPSSKNSKHLNLAKHHSEHLTLSRIDDNQNNEIRRWSYNQSQIVEDTKTLIDIKSNYKHYAKRRKNGANIYNKKKKKSINIYSKKKKKKSINTYSKKKRKAINTKYNKYNKYKMHTSHKKSTNGPICIGYEKNMYNLNNKNLFHPICLTPMDSKDYEDNTNPFRPSKTEYVDNTQSTKAINMDKLNGMKCKIPRKYGINGKSAKRKLTPIPTLKRTPIIRSRDNIDKK